MPKVNTEFSITIPKNCKNAVLVDYMAQRFSYRSRETWIEKISVGEVLVNEQTTQANHPLRPGDVVKYLILNYEEPWVPTSVEDIYRGTEFSILGKSASIPVHRSSRILVNTFTNLARKHTGFPEMIPMHRLDAETSGLMLYANTKETALKHQKNVHKILLRKFYLCGVTGAFTQTQFCEVHLSERENSLIRSQMHIVATGEGKLCQTTFHPLCSNSKHSLVLAEIHTGRKHQIRASLKHIGHPILGDKIYSHNGEFYLKRLEGPLKSSDFETMGSSIQLLHSFGSLIQLPEEEPQLFFSAAFTPHFFSFLNTFDNPIQKAKARICELLKSN